MSELYEQAPQTPRLPTLVTLVPLLQLAHRTTSARNSYKQNEEGRKSQPSG